VSVDTGGGIAIDGNVKSGDFTGRDDRQQNVNFSFAPSEPTLRQPGVVYTIQEMFAAMERKLDEHGKQLLAIWSELQAVKFEQAALGREINEMKNGEQAAHDKEEKRQQRALVLWFRIATIVFLVIITSMMWWLISHVGGL
jgi:hypothetical protein